MARLRPRIGPTAQSRLRICDFTQLLIPPVRVTEMLSLIETLTGFAAIMMMLSLLVKTAVS